MAALAIPYGVLLGWQPGAATWQNKMTTKSNDGWIGVIKGKPDIGQFAERGRITCKQDITSFTEMTGDRNPVHYDEELAKKTPVGKLIVQGGVTSGILNALVAEDLPARYGNHLHDASGRTVSGNNDAPNTSKTA